MFNILKEDFAYPGRNESFRLKIETFSLNRGEIVFLHGRSGCGKTTLLNLLSGVITSNIAMKCHSFFNSIAYVMHESTLLPWQSVKGNIKIEAKLRNKTANIDLFLVLCKKFDLKNNILELMPNKLSLGMRQRIEIAKALSFQPELLLLDEALSGIDAGTKRKVVTCLWDEVESGQITVVGTAHHMGDLLMLAQRIYLVDGEKIDATINIDKPVSERIGMDIEALYKLESAKPLFKHTA